MLEKLMYDTACTAVPILIILGILYLGRNDIREILISWGFIDTPMEEYVSPKKTRKSK